MDKRLSVRQFRIALALACLVAISIGSTAIADDSYPVFRKGMWQVQDTLEMNGKSFLNPWKKCMDPTFGVRAQLQPGTHLGGCVTSAPRKSGNRYESVTTCTGAMAAMGRSKRVITVEGDSAYTDVSEQQMGKTLAKDTVIARRVGDCP